MAAAVCALAASASRISSVRCEGESARAAWAGLPLAAASGAFSGAAVAAPDCTAAAMSADTPTRATAAARRGVVWGVRLREGLLLNTDSFCAAAGHAARGDPTAGEPCGHDKGGTQ